MSIQLQEADILFALETAGRPITFSCGEIKGICLTDLYLVTTGTENTVMQEYTFIIYEKDYNLLELSEDDEFTYLPGHSKRLYCFKIDSFLFDMTGWVNLHCSYIGIRNV